MNISNKFRNNQELLITIVIVCGIIALVNFFASQFFWRLDLTRDQRYSISTTTKETVRQLEDLVTVKLYFSEDLPNQYSLVKQQVIDILQDYQGYGSNFKYEIINPGTGEEADKAGIPKIQFNEIKQDKFQVGTGYMGMVINYQDKNEIIPLIEDTKTLEYQLTAIIMKLSAKEPLVLGLVQSHGVPSIDSELKIFHQELSKLYQVKLVDLKTKKIDDTIKTLVIIGLKENLSKDELEVVDRFLMSGKAVLILQDGVNIYSEPVHVAIANQSNFLDYPAKYGIKINKDLVSDLNSGLATFNQGFFNINIDYYLWPKISKDQLDSSNSSMSQLDSLILPWASSLSLDKSLMPNANYSELIRSSNHAWTQTEKFNLDPNAQVLSPDKKSYLMAVKLTGELKSPYSNSQTTEGKLIVVGNSNFIKSDFINGNQNNLLFAQNLIDSVTLNADLSNIRSKNISSNSITPITEPEKQTLRYLNVFGITVLVFVYGMSRYYFRKKSKTLAL
jgi:gliding-associated putative ABC transporter substrate-binding component GldG